MHWKSVRTIVPACLLLLGLTLTLRAQQEGQADPPPPAGARHGGPPTPAMEVARLDKALTLTDAQKSSILAILTKTHTEMEALRSSGADSAATRDQVHALRSSSRSQVRAQLTEAQQAKYDAMRPPHPPSNGTGGPGQGNDAPPAPPEGSASPQ